MTIDEAGSRSFFFDSYHLIPSQHLLMNGNERVRLGSRAFGLLVALVERPGETLTKADLIRRVWHDTVVDDGAVKVHISALRRALRDGQDGRRYISSVSGRGYSFVVPVHMQGLPEPGALDAARGSGAKPKFATPLVGMIGRSETVAALASMLEQQRMVTIVGAGGIGKTTVAVAVGDTLREVFADGICFVDLAPLASEERVLAALAAALGVAAGAGDPLAAALAHLRDKATLIVLDNCEHVIDAASTMVEDVLRATSRVHILATSREALRTEGERVYRLPSLASPDAALRPSAQEAIGYSAVQLFVERAAASLDDFRFGDHEAPLVAELCRRLDGIALAIEIVAGWVGTFGLAGLVAMLDERFRLELLGRRTALPRHKTLFMTIDWSHELLPEQYRVVLRRLSVFRGSFSVDAVRAVVADDIVSSPGILEAIAELVAKSLVAPNVDAETARYRLLDTTRGYAAIKLEESGEWQVVRRRHAAYYRTYLETAYQAWSRQSAAEWIGRHRGVIDDVRAALDWAFSAGGDAEIGVALAVSAVPLWFHLGLTSECTEKVNEALAAPAAVRSLDSEMRLYAARAWSLMQTKGLAGETLEAWGRVLEIARDQQDPDHELRALWGLWAGLLNNGELSRALALAQEFCKTASRAQDELAVWVGDRMVGYIQHLLGDHEEAQRHLVNMLARYRDPVIGAQMIRFVFDQKATARCFLARIMFLQGQSSLAMGIIRSLLDDTAVQADVLTLCQVLVQGACPTALLVGNLQLAEECADVLVDLSAQHGLSFWNCWGRAFQAVTLIKKGQVEAGIAQLKGALSDLRDRQYGVFYVFFTSEFAAGLAGTSQPADGLAVIDEALARSDRNSERWYGPEIMRIKGDLLQLRDDPDAVTMAETAYRRSLEWAQAQQAIAWELRTSTSLAELLKANGREAEAREILRAVIKRLPEAAGSSGLAAAEDAFRSLSRNAKPARTALDGAPTLGKSRRAGASSRRERPSRTARASGRSD